MNQYFDADWYLWSHPDVAAAVGEGLITAQEHFERYGQFEQRSPGPFFNVDAYLRQNPDVAAAVHAGLISAYDHYIQFGIHENRPPLSLVFNEEFYLQQNPDVAAAVDAGLTTASEHFLRYGQHEARSTHPFLDLNAYVGANPDVAEIHASGNLALLWHLLTVGVAEGRDLGNGIDLSIFAGSPIARDLLAAGDSAALLDFVGSIIPFLPTFVPAPGWEPPSDLAIPLNFIPPGDIRLVIPDGVRIPEGLQLPPDIFEPEPTPEPEPQPELEPEPEPEPPAFGLQETNVASFAHISFVNPGSQITVTAGPEGTLLFTSAGQTVRTDAHTDSIEEIATGAGTTLIGSAADLTNFTLSGEGSVNITDATGRQSLNILTTGTNTIAAGTGADSIGLGAGIDTVKVTLDGLAVLYSATVQFDLESGLHYAGNTLTITLDGVNFVSAWEDDAWGSFLPEGSSDEMTLDFTLDGDGLVTITSSEYFNVDSAQAMLGDAEDLIAPLDSGTSDASDISATRASVEPAAYESGLMIYSFDPVNDRLDLDITTLIAGLDTLTPGYDNFDNLNQIYNGFAIVKGGAELNGVLNDLLSYMGSERSVVGFQLDSSFYVLQKEGLIELIGVGDFGYIGSLGEFII